RAQKQIFVVAEWENSKKAAAEAKLKKIEVNRNSPFHPRSKYILQEQLEKKKAGYTEKMKNGVAQIHKEAEEKRAMAEEMAAKYRATGQVPKKLIGCF
ncbi:Remorin 1.4, partial [Linum perenne]